MSSRRVLLHFSQQELVARDTLNLDSQEQVKSSRISKQQILQTRRINA
jgi:hypothetical protein